MPKPPPASVPAETAPSTSPPHAVRLRFAALTASALLLTACGGEQATNPGSGSPAAGPGLALPEEAAHVHGVAANHEGDILVATHHGIYEVPESGQEPELVSPVMDFMGFTRADSQRLLASGHPGPDVDLPDPVGLLESTDDGRTWEPLSRTGESDFHALTATEEMIVGFDGALRSSEDGETWTDLPAEFAPISLAISTDARTVLATTQESLLRSTDGGADFQRVPDSPPLVFVAWVPGTDTVYGLGVEGGVWRSGDAGESWSDRAVLPGGPEALHADAERVVAVAEGHVLVSTDEAESFHAPGAGS